MKQKNIIIFCSFIGFLILFALSTVKLEAAITITSNESGTYEGYDYMLSKDSENTSMILKDDGTFSCEWNNDDYLFSRLGKSFD